MSLHLTADVHIQVAPQCALGPSDHPGPASGRGEPPPGLSPEPGRCAYFLGGRKARFCRSMAVAGQRFCGNHLQGTALAAPRVPCPLDPSHSVLLSELEVHVSKRCPALALAQRERAQSHFLEDANAGSDCEPDLPQPPPPPIQQTATDTAADPASYDTAAGGACVSVCLSSGHAATGGCPSGGAAVAPPRVPALGPFQKGRAAQRAALARSLGEAAFTRLLARVESAYAAACGGRPPPPSVLRPAECAEVLAAPSDCRPFDLKHGLQQASILGNMQRVGLLEPGPRGGAGVAVVELGAGKGYLGASLAGCCGVERLVATDIKAGLKLKADRHLRHIVFARHRVDLKDYVPAATPELTAATAADAAAGAAGVAGTPATVPWVAVAKHLCGAATDYGLRACLLPPDAKRAAEAAAAAAGANASACEVDAGHAATEAGSTAGGPAAGDAAAAAAAATAGGAGSGSHGGDEAHAQAEKRPRLGAEGAAATGDAQGRDGAGAGGEHNSDADVAGAAGGAASHGGGGGLAFRGLAIAPCCHHRCGWRAYVGKPLFRRLGLGPHDFELISWMTGWALCGHDTPAGAAATAARGSEDGDGDGGSGEADGGCAGCECGCEDCECSGEGQDGHTDGGTSADPRGGGGGPGAMLCSAAGELCPAEPELPRHTNSQAAGSQDGDGHRAGTDGAVPGAAAAVAAEAAAQPPPRFDPAARLSRRRRMAVGQMCKQLIEAGRLDWLRARFRSAELVSYIGPEVTGENRLLLAVGPLAGGGGQGGGGKGGDGQGGGDGGGGGC